MKRYIVFALIFLVFPSFAAAANFAKQTLFLSKSPVVEGETVLIHTVVANDAASKFTGEVVFKDGDARIGAVAVTIAASGANTVSLSWKPTAGSHKISADLTSSTGAVVESQSATFTINEKPKPSSAGTTTTKAGVESSENIQNSISSYVPSASGYIAPLFSVVDTGRAQAAGLLDSGIEWARQTSSGGANSTSGEVLGSSTAPQAGGGFLESAKKIGASAALPVFSMLRSIVGSAGLFYPIFALLFFFILWRIYKRMRRPDYSSAA
ncbi:MAG TPA: hypothetical protein VD928_02755 [Candidatus Paceibacterota bacterium]|nr:hypothetical protein [Candidatus Paceibacterota bacterium]